MRVTFHRNLSGTNGNAWSFVFNGKATQAKTIYATDVSVKQPSGKKFAVTLGGGKRSVYAWFRADDIDTNVARDISPDAVRIRFNPKLGQTYFQTNEGERVDFMHQVWCLENGECFAVIK